MKTSVRHAETDDYRALQELYAQPGVIHGALQLPYTSQASWKKRMEDKPDNVFIFVAQLDEMLAGSLTMVTEKNIRRKHVASIMMGVHDDWQNKGIGSALMKAAIDYSDNWLNLGRLELTAFSDNTAAIALYKKYGFEEEGVLRKFAFRDGQFQDAIALARVRF